MKTTLLAICLILSACATPNERYCRNQTGQDTEPQQMQGKAPIVGLINLFSGWGEARRKRRAMDECMKGLGDSSMFQYKTPRDVHYPHSPTFMNVRKSA